MKPGPFSLEDINAAGAAAVERLQEVEGDIDRRKSDLLAASEDLSRMQEGFETRGSTLTKFLNDLTNVAAEVEFQKQAEGYERESRRFWVAGLVTLIAAGCVALLPLILNYLNPEHHGLEGQSNVSAHLAVAVAFAAIPASFSLGPETETATVNVIGTFPWP